MNALLNDFLQDGDFLSLRQTCGHENYHKVLQVSVLNLTDLICEEQSLNLLNQSFLLVKLGVIGRLPHVFASVELCALSSLWQLELLDNLQLFANVSDVRLAKLAHLCL